MPALLKTKHIGNNQFESQCLNCGETMLWQKGDDVFTQVLDNGDMGLLCSKCYDGPRMSREDFEKRQGKQG
jgi:hypothetical protein